MDEDQLEVEIGAQNNENSSDSSEADFSSDEDTNFNDKYEIDNVFRTAPPYTKGNERSVNLTNVPDLKEIAFFHIALALWHHVDLPYDVHRRYGDKSEWSSLLSAVNDSVKTLPVPKTFTSIIQHYVNNIMHHVDEWVCYHFDVILLNHGRKYDLYSHFSRFVWFPNGTIDYRQTARCLLNSRRLTDLEKFRLSCTYCLQEEINQRWPSLLEDRIFDCVDFSEYPLIYYWNSLCKNEPSKIPHTEGLSVDDVMFRENEVNNWWAKEYFFDRLDSAEVQVQSVIWVIDEGPSEYLRLLMMKLNKAQRFQVYADRAVRIIVHYLILKVDYRIILSTWYDVHELISGPDFVSILSAVWRSIERNIDLLTEIWISASDKLKIHLLKFSSEKYIRLAWNLWKRPYHDLFYTLQDSSPDIIKEFAVKRPFVNYCAELIRSNKLSTVVRLLQICFPRERESAQFKANLAKACRGFYEYYENLIICENLSMLEKLLSFLFPQSEELIKFQRSFIKKEFFVKCCKKLITDNKLRTVEQLFALCLPNNEKSVQFKRNLMRTKIVSEFCEGIVIGEKPNVVDQLLNLCFVSVTEKIQFKKELVMKHSIFEWCQQMITSDKLDAVDQLLDFCLVDCHDKMQFRKNLIKTRSIEKYFQRMIRDENFNTMDHLLNFSLPDIEEIVQIKKDLLLKKNIDEYCNELIINGKLDTLNRLLNFCLLDARETVLQVKRDLLKKKKIFAHCEKTIVIGNLNELHQLLNFCLPDTQERIQFTENLVFNSINIFQRCTLYYSSFELTNLNEFLTQLLSCPKIILEYKKKLIMSSDCIDKLVRFFNTENQSSLNSIIIDGLLTKDAAVEFKKQLVYSWVRSPNFNYHSMQGREWNDMVRNIETFIPSSEDRKTLKKEMLSLLSPYMNEKCFENSESGWLFILRWCTVDTTDMQKAKCLVPIDQIFENILKGCMFSKYDKNNRASRCTLKKNVDFTVLNRFLVSHFKSPKDIKAYKASRANAYKDIMVINVLLEKKCHPSYLRKLMTWFFENNATQLAEFKIKHKGDIISTMVKLDRDSYVKLRR